jgi:hypothetical protein
MSQENVAAMNATGLQVKNAQIAAFTPDVKPVCVN